MLLFCGAKIKIFFVFLYFLPFFNVIVTILTKKIEK